MNKKELIKEKSRDNEYTKINVLSYEISTVEETTKLIMEQLIKMKLDISGPIPLPTKTKTIVLLKSPHKHNKAKEKFCRIVHRRAIMIKGKIPSNTVNTLSRIKIPSTASLTFKLAF